MFSIVDYKWLTKRLWIYGWKIRIHSFTKWKMYKLYSTETLDRWISKTSLPSSSRTQHKSTMPSNVVLEHCKSITIHLFLDDIPQTRTKKQSPPPPHVCCYFTHSNRWSALFWGFIVHHWTNYECAIRGGKILIFTCIIYSSSWSL